MVLNYDQKTIVAEIMTYSDIICATLSVKLTCDLWDIKCNTSIIACVEEVHLLCLQTSETLNFSSKFLFLAAPDYCLEFMAHK